MTRKLRFGLQFDLRNPPLWHQPWAKLYAESLEFAAWTESLGFDDVWLSEHHMAEDGYLPSPLVFAGALAAKTKTIRIGTAIAIAPMYHPVRLAEDCAVVDILSNGRFLLGLGLGYRAAEFAGYGMAREGRGTLTDEMLQIVRRLWSGETVSFNGKYFAIENARIQPRPVQTHLPIWIGGFNRPAMRRAARFGDGYIGGGDMALRYRELTEEFAAVGKDPKSIRMICGRQWWTVSNDPEKTFHEIAPHILHQINTYAEWLQGSGHQLYAPMDVPALKASGNLQVMTPDQAIAAIGKIAETTAVEGIYGMMPPAGYPLKNRAEHIELFANKVLPAFR